MKATIFVAVALAMAASAPAATIPEKRLVDTLKPILQGVTKPLKPITGPLVNILPAENAEQQDPLGLQQVLVKEGQVNPVGGLTDTLGLRDVARAEKPEKCLVPKKAAQSFELPEKIADKYTRAYVCTTFTKVCSEQKHDKEVSSIAVSCTRTKRKSKTGIKASCVLNQKHGKSYSLTARAAADTLEKLGSKHNKAAGAVKAKVAKIPRVEICKSA